MFAATGMLEASMVMNEQADLTVDLSEQQARVHSFRPTCPPHTLRTPVDGRIPAGITVNGCLIASSQPAAEPWPCPALPLSHSRHAKLAAELLSRLPCFRRSCLPHSAMSQISVHACRC